MNQIKSKMIRISIILLAVSVSACAPSLEPVEDDDMVGTGRGTDEYKLSPCACESIELPGPTEDTLKSLQAIYG